MTQKSARKSFRISLVLYVIIVFIVSAANCAREDFEKEDLEIFEKGQTFYLNKKFDDAKMVLDPLCKKYSGNVECGVLLAKISISTRNFKDAEETLRALLKKHPESPYVLKWLGDVVYLRDPAEAIDLYRKILKNDPENYEAHYRLGRCLRDAGKVREALHELTWSLGMKRDLSKINLYMGRMFHEMGMEDRASEHFKEVRSLGDPEDAAEIPERSDAPPARRR